MLLEKKTIYSIRRDAAFGDQLLATLMVHVLNDNGIESTYETRTKKETTQEYNSCQYIEKLIDCPITKNVNLKKYQIKQHWAETMPNEHLYKGNILESFLENFCKKENIKKKILIKKERNYIPVVYYDIPEIKETDISLALNAGTTGKYKEWPYKKELKEQLKKNNISYVDLEHIKDIKCLNHVKKSKLYLGIDTGISHYVSMICPQSLIIQSGVTSYKWWCLYGYDYIEHPVECSSCFLKSSKNDLKCLNSQKCTFEIHPKTVIKKIKEKLGK